MTIRRILCTDICAVVALSAIMALCAGESAAQTVDAQERIQKMTDATTLNQDSLRPWHLVMTFSLNDLKGKHQEDGTIEEWWVTPAKYKIVVTSPSLNETLPLAAGDLGVLNRQAYLVDQLLRMVTRPVPYYRSFDHLTAREVDRMFGKVKLSCIRVGNDTDKTILSKDWSGAEYCTEPGKDAVRAELGGAQFADLRNRMGTFQNINVALDNGLSYEGVTAITGHVQMLQALSAEQMPSDLKESTNVDDKLPPVVLNARARTMVPPTYPLRARSLHLSGSVVLAAVITKEGTVKDLTVIASSDESFSEAAKDAVRHWTFDPYLADGVPIDVQTTIDNNFLLNR